MARKSTMVRLFGENESFKCWIEHDDSVARLVVGSVCVYYDPRYPDELRELGVREVSPPKTKSSSADINPPSSISFAEMAANAGVGVRPGIEITDGEIKAAQLKVAWYPHVGCNKAPLPTVGARW